MDSELTLVNPAPPTPYFLSSSDLRDALIFTHPTKPLYRITSDARHINIFDGSPPNRTIAVVHRRDLFPDMISFPEVSHESTNTSATVTQMSLNRWLKRSRLPDGTPAFMVDTRLGRYFWKNVSKYKQKVFAEFDLENPIASCYFYPPFPADRPAFVLQSAGEPLRNEIVIVYLIQRHRVALENKALDLFVGPY